jgi:hypothetical protein
MKMEKTKPVETIPEMGRRTTMEGVNSTIIYCMSFYKFLNVPPAQ